jgi:hypothetical protein
MLSKPARHVERIADLTFEEAAEMRVVLHRASGVVGHLTQASQVYVCLCSHGPAHRMFAVYHRHRADLYIDVALPCRGLS